MDERARERLRDAGLPETPLYRLRELRRIAQEEDRSGPRRSSGGELKIPAEL